jgi:hypothetical protein
MVVSGSAKATKQWHLALGGVILAVIHFLALLVLVGSEEEPIEKVAFLLFWGLLNFLWIAALRRPNPAAALSLSMIIALVLLSQFKHDAFNLTVTFMDVMIIDPDTTAFLWKTFPNLGTQLATIGGVGLAGAVLLGLIDPFRMRRRTGLMGLLLCFVLLAVLSFAVPLDREDEHRDRHFVSKFGRSASIVLVDLAARGMFEADAKALEPLMPDDACAPPAKLPHIIMILDESSFDATQMPGIRVHRDYQTHFQSFDGRSRRLLVEGVGGPTWYTEYNVLSGLSIRSYGRFAEAVTRIAAGRVRRGLPLSLRRCGYRTFSVYPFMGEFLGARGYQATAGFEHFYDSNDLGTQEGNLLTHQIDAFYYDFALRKLRQELGSAPTFFFLYTTANHAPWDFRFREDLLPNWPHTGNPSHVDEFLRRQLMSAAQYQWLLRRLRQEFPDEPFLIVRFGDHQPLFARHFIDPSIDERTLAQRVRDYDPRYLTTYYSIDTINFTPPDLSSALDQLDAPYLPIVVMEAAGVPLDASFTEQKAILKRCGGLFYSCNGGLEARRFNRLLIDARLIKGL